MEAATRSNGKHGETGGAKRVAQAPLVHLLLTETSQNMKGSQSATNPIEATPQTKTAFGATAKALVRDS
jgi:hypothetical protein